MSYKQFIDDPLGQKTKQKEEEAKRKKHNDPFIDRIKLIQDTEQAHNERRPVNQRDLKKHNKVTILEAKQRYIEDPSIHILDSVSKDDDDDQDHLIGRGRLAKELVKIPAVYLEKTQ